MDKKATIVDAVTGKQTVIEKGNTENALYYEMCDMEEAVRNQDASHLNLEYTKDVMDIMSQLRKEWKNAISRRKMVRTNFLSFSLCSDKIK